MPATEAQPAEVPEPPLERPPAQAPPTSSDRLSGGTQRLIGGLVFAGLVALALAWASSFWLFIGAGYFATVIAAISLNLIFGYDRQIVIAQAAFAGIGAYGFALGVRHGWPPLVAAVVGVLATTVLTSLVALPALRLRGLYLGIATLALQVGFSGVLESWTKVTGGQEGLPIPGIRGGGLGPLDRDQFWFLLSAVVAFGVLLSFARYIRGTGGRALASLRESPHAAEALGARPFLWRLTTFAFSGMLAGIAGVLIAGQAAFVSPGSFSVDATLLYFLVIIIGGVGRVGGPVVGAAVAVGLPRWLNNMGWASTEPVVFPALVIIGLILLPGGFVGLPQQLRQLVHRLRQQRAGAQPYPGLGSDHQPT
jgi:ABC-type branched-subunit amino acid transport system permease subunit